MSISKPQYLIDFDNLQEIIEFIQGNITERNINSIENYLTYFQQIEILNKRYKPSNKQNINKVIKNIFEEINFIYDQTNETNTDLENFNFSWDLVDNLEKELIIFLNELKEQISPKNKYITFLVLIMIILILIFLFKYLKK